MSDGHSTVEYRDIPEFPGYRIGSDGSVWSCRNSQGGVGGGRWRRLRERVMPNGYRQACLMPGPTYRYVHRLILEAFVGPCPPGMVACHNDGDRSNNTPGNLRWDTVQSNLADKVRHGTQTRGECHPAAKVTAETVCVIRARYAAGGVLMRELAAEYSLSPGGVLAIIHRKVWKHLV